MKPEDKSRLVIDKKLKESGWAVQDVKSVNLTASLGVAVREFPTSTGPVDYAHRQFSVPKLLQPRRGNPFDRKGGLGRFYEIFGEGYAAILTEMNLELVA